MEIIISSNTNKPIYEQITEQIKAMVMCGELKNGDPIPSMRALAKSLHVSRQRKFYIGKQQRILSGGTAKRYRTSFRRSGAEGTQMWDLIRKADRPSEHIL